MIFGLFRNRDLLDPGTTRWLIDTYAWALKNFGSDIFYEDTLLVTPTNKHFPDKVENAHKMASVLFQKVKEYAGMEDWACELIAQEPDENPVVGPTLIIKNALGGAAGTFSFGGKEELKATITYNPALVKNPMTLVATFAHELAHYLSNTAHEPPPGGEEFWEPATDILAIFMGFGLFLANSAFTFNQYTDVNSQGWSTQTQGYLSQYESTYALALFSVLKEIPASEIEPYLKKSLRSFYRKALKEIHHNQQALHTLKSANSPRKTSNT